MKTSIVEIASTVEKLILPINSNFEKDDTTSSNHSINWEMQIPKSSSLKTDRSGTSFVCYWYPVTQYYLPQNHHCFVVALGEAKAMGVNPDRKSGVEPRRRLVEQCETFRQLLQLRWHRPYRLVLSVGPYQQRREGDPGDWAHQDFHIFRPGLHLERSLQLR